MRISDWSSDVCSSDLYASQSRARIHAQTRIQRCILQLNTAPLPRVGLVRVPLLLHAFSLQHLIQLHCFTYKRSKSKHTAPFQLLLFYEYRVQRLTREPCLNVFISPMTSEFAALRSEEHTSELKSLMRISYAVFCLKKK